jgi:nicotinamide-nucleotide amidase
LVLTTAESCTGGWVAQCVTDVPGSSAWFDGGFVTYSNAAKEAMLGVPAFLLAAHGAVSEPVASAMAAGALQSGRADLAVAITGIAGPSGGTTDKPVGMVCFAFQRRAEQCTTTTEFFRGNRREIRQQAVEFALISSRLFFALWPGDSLSEDLSVTAHDLEQNIKGVCIARKHLHLTLVFLGQVGVEKQAELIRLAAGISAEAFTMVLTHGLFWPRNGILCLTSEPAPKPLLNLAASLAELAQTAGIQLEKRPFIPHITVIRKAMSPEQRFLLPKPVYWPIDEFHLVESSLLPDGPIHRILQSWAISHSGTMSKSLSMG